MVVLGSVEVLGQIPGLDTGSGTARPTNPYLDPDIGEADVSRLDLPQANPGGYVPTNPYRRYFSSALVGGMAGQSLPLVPLEGPIDPAAYTVGPGDVLSLSLIDGRLPPQQLIVTPEGRLVIPTVGDLPVAGRMLDDVRALVTKAVARRYLNTAISLTLTTPRVFTVQVAGVVDNPGPAQARAVDRVSQVVVPYNTVPNNDPRRAQLPAGQEGVRSSMRHIALRRRDGTTRPVDLVLYYATGDSAYNPTLRDGDRILVLPEELQGSGVAISGAVRVEGRYEYRTGDTFTRLMQIAQGPKDIADMAAVELVRVSEGSTSFSRQMLDADAILSGRLSDVPLMAGDRIFVREKPNFRERRTISIRGEVRIPGAYAIAGDTTRLTTLVGLAGGFTPRADLRRARLIRFPIRYDDRSSDPTVQRLERLRLSDLTAESQQYFNYEAVIRTNQVSVDFQRLFGGGDQREDVLLRDGDLLIVPTIERTVYISGQVVRPGYVRVGDDWKAKRYIDEVGGFSRGARESGVYVLKAGSQVWLPANQATIEPGDEIFVDKTVNRSTRYYWDIGKDVLTVVGSLASLYLAYIAARSVSR